MKTEHIYRQLLRYDVPKKFNRVKLSLCMHKLLNQAEDIYQFGDYFIYKEQSYINCLLVDKKQDNTLLYVRLNLIELLNNTND